MAEHVVILSRRYEVPGGQPFDSVVLREPTYADVYMSGLGRPEEWQPGRGGSPVRIVFPEVVDAYLRKITVRPGYECLSELAAVDGVKLEREICGFFRERTEPRK